MDKIINTLKHGDAKTKLILLLSFVTGVASLVLFVLTLVTGQMLLFFFGVLGVFVTISLVQTFGIYQEENPIDALPGYKDKEKFKKQKNILASENAKNSYGAEEDEVNKIKPVREKKTKERKLKEKKVKEPKNKKESRIKQAKQEKNNKDIYIPEQENFNECELYMEETEEAEFYIQPTEEIIGSYDKKKIKKTLHKYKVKKDHRMALIDRCDKYNIHQTPAYIWTEDNKFHMLLIEKEPRYITLPLFNLGEIKYLKKQPANPDADYMSIKGNSIMANLFKPYMPDYMHSNVVDDLTYYKNLYGVGPDIYFTNQSAKHLFDLVSTEFFVEDKVTTSTKVNFYFKDAYKANIMLRDSVIDANGYADMISNILENMAMSTLSYNEFKDTLNLMIKNKLITQEFASYYMDVRDKNSHK